MFLKTTDYDGVEFGNYNGTYEIKACSHKDEKHFQKWAMLQIGRDKYSEKAIPVKVVLGDVEKAEFVLLQALAYITGKTYVEKPLEDTPF